jgi:hypothetical protein
MQCNVIKNKETDSRVALRDEIQWNEIENSATEGNVVHAM